ncbi:putative aldouronate transport system permease protein [Paenibacillus sp. UNCCL117]|uniref:carbohydrate ABC transporter permease n=1 Tax=unclassified Paenibacillus TaxID=185978 RepID=UPI00088A9AD1|nr:MULTISPECIES: carbohydrate ABC transporter permease [unclassified Paenibacillus]SDB99566.1 putative aldouronate transport system permease protein [Paenibacillus sp. cl123]SFW69156.1 putative aldouronate transport system permease protein [Paenibacillus sp. UNCCL117]
MVVKKTVGDYIFDSVNMILLAALAVMTAYPFVYVIFASLSQADELTAHSGILLKPLGLSLDAYKAVLKNPMIYTGYMNTLFIVVVGTAYNIIMTSMGAFVLSRKDFFWRKPMTIMIVFTMFFGGGLIPNFLLVKNLGLMDSLWALIIPGAIGTWNLIIMRTAFQGIPDSLIESAHMDGAHDFIVLFKIILPLALPTIAVMVLYYGVGHWNAWFGAMIYLRNRDLWPLQLALREILISNSTDEMMSGTVAQDRQSIGETIKYATIMVATLPILAAYPFLQKYFVKGVMVGALKG